MAKKVATEKPAPVAGKVGVNLFAKAASTAAKTTPAKKSKGTILRLPVLVDPATKEMTEESKALHDAVREVIEADREKKAAEGREKSAKGIVAPVATELLCEEWAHLGCQPETPITVMAADGSSVTYVLSNKAGQYAWSDEQHEALCDMIGPEAAEKCVHMRTSFSLDEEVLNEEGVLEKLNGALAASGLSEEQLGRLLKAESVRKLKPLTITNLTQIVGNDPKKLEEAFSFLGSTLVRYLKS